MHDSLRQSPTSSAWSRFSLISLCAVAISVSLGTALVSISKALLLIALLGQLKFDGPAKVLDWLRHAPNTVWVISAAVVWFSVTLLWTEAATTVDAFAALTGHARLLWLVVALYLIATPARAWIVLCCLMGSQAFVVVLSWLLWLGVPLGWITSKYPPESGISFTSSLEQPVMGTLLVVLLWAFRSRLSANAFLGRNAKFLVYGFLIITIANIFFIMTGRTGYLVMIVFLCMAIFTALPKNAKIVSIFLPILAVLLIFQFSDRFQRRVTQVHDEIVQYEKGDASTSQGIRLDHWRVSIQGIAERPILGHGVGSFAVVYQKNHGRENRISRDPHQQYLFWWVEGGILGITLLLSFFGALIKDAGNINHPSGWALVCTTAVAATMALANCPFFGAGMSEFFLVMMAALLCMKSLHKARLESKIDAPPPATTPQ